MRLRIPLASALVLVACLASPTVAAPAPPPGVKHARVGPVQLAYRTSGHGRALLLINGSGATLDTWDPALLAKLGTRRRVIVYDPRNLGASSAAPSLATSVRQQAADAAGLLRRLHVARADVLGWSFGGYVAQELALRRPRLVRRLVLASTDFGGPRAVLSDRRTAEIDDRATRGEASVDELLAVLFPEAARDAGLGWITRLFAQPGACCEPVDRRAGQAIVVAEDRWHASGHGVYKRLPHLRAPTLIGAGRKDIDIPAVNARLLARRIPQARLLLYPRAGHAFLVQYHARFGRAVLRFLAARA